MESEATMLAPCGIDCLMCPAYQLTQEDDIDGLSALAEEWAQGDAHYEAEDLLCDGCYGERVAKDCRLCWIKGCVQEKGLETCAGCGGYPCDRLLRDWGEWRFNSATDARARLDRKREELRLGD